MHQPEIMQVLKDAQLAHQAGDFVNALKFYQYFFDHALDEDPYALYGVRISHCLEGWASLAKDFLGARNELQVYQENALSAYMKNKKPELYHDYYSISKVLGLHEQAVDQFLIINSEYSEDAKKLVKFVWEDLISRQLWSVCNQFLDEPVQKLDESFELFDQAVKLQDIDSSFANAAFEEHILVTLVASIEELIMVLRHNNRSDEVSMIERKFFEIAHAKQHSGLSSLIQSKGSFLFSGH